MKQITIFLLLISSFQIYSQNDFLTFEKALQRSKAESKPIMLVFSGSDWCKPCIALKKNVLESKSFEHLQEEVIFMYLDFPYKKANRLSKAEMYHNENLAERYNPKGYFPKTIMVDSGGKVIQQITYKKGMTPDDFLAQIKKEI